MVLICKHQSIFFLIMTLSATRIASLNYANPFLKKKKKNFGNTFPKQDSLILFKMLA